MEDSGQAVAGAELRQFVERIERLEEERREIAEQIKEVYAELKSRGFQPAITRKIVAIRKRDKDDLAEEEAILEMYKSALGM